MPGGPLGAPDLLPPPSGDVLQQGLDEWERWIHNVDIPLLMRIAIGHYQFEALHPFIDGNGRMGRLVAQLQLVEGKVLAYPILNLSPYLEPRADEYRESLRELSVTGDRDPWLSFFLNAMLTQAEVASHRTQSLLLLRDELIDIVKKQGIRGVAVDIAGGLIGYPVTTLTFAARAYGVNIPGGELRDRTPRTGRHPSRDIGEILRSTLRRSASFIVDIARRAASMSEDKCSGQGAACAGGPLMDDHAA